MESSKIPQKGQRQKSADKINPNKWKPQKAQKLVEPQKEKISEMTRKNEKVWTLKYLLAHFDDNVRVAANDISDSKIDAFFHTNSEKTHQVLHGCYILIWLTYEEEKRKRRKIYMREEGW